MGEYLLQDYDGLVCDLDGVVYAGPSAVPHAVESLSRAGESNVGVIYATNNASRPPSAVSAHLRELGLKCDDQAVINSSMAGAYVLSRDGFTGSVLAVGGQGVALALNERGFDAVQPRDHANKPGVKAVLQGYGAEVTAADLAEAAYAIQNGARWVATNTDTTLPTDRGRAPGNGSLVRAVGLAVDVEPVVAGKPEPVMYELASERMGCRRERVLAVGDRLETDIQGASAGGFASALVLTGVHGWADAAAAEPARRPTYVLADLRGLWEGYEVAEVGSQRPSADAPLPTKRSALLYAWAQVDAGAWTTQEAYRHLDGTRP